MSVYIVNEDINIHGIIRVARKSVKDSDITKDDATKYVDDYIKNRFGMLSNEVRISLHYDDGRLQWIAYYRIIISR